MPRSPPPHPPSSYWIRLVGWLVEFFPSSSHKTNKKGWTTAQLTHALPLEQLTCFSHTGKSWRLGWGGTKDLGALSLGSTESPSWAGNKEGMLHHADPPHFPSSLPTIPPLTPSSDNMPSLRMPFPAVVPVHGLSPLQMDVLPFSLIVPAQVVSFFLFVPLFWFFRFHM